MKRLVNQLREFASDVPGAQRPVELSVSEERIFRSLKTTGERATKGRLISRCVFEAKDKGSGASLMMIMEGRHSMSVGRQVARRFEEMNEINFADVVRTKSGAYVILRPRGENDA